MPYYYFDSTALVKRYSRERGSRIVNSLMTKRDKTILIGGPTITEFYAVFAQKTREGQLTRDDWYTVLFKFEAESLRGVYHFAIPTSETFTSTKELLFQYPHLHTPQAVHLMLAQEFKSLRLTIVSTDRQILELCKPLGMNAINPEDE
ncbi:MAG: type II toxin-antitoxin system VapC family toxin [Nitrospira sp.]|nr:type II toxin-antitoxin system VapC family toxin [Nitrospira sp.]